MIRTLALFVFVAPAALASGPGDLDLPEAEVPVETVSVETIDLSDEDDFEFDAPVANAVPVVPTSAPARAEVPSDTASPVRTSFAPAPKLPSVDHVDFEDDFEFEAASLTAAPAGRTTSVELVDLDGEVEAQEANETEDTRPALDELEIIDDLEDKSAAVESSAQAGDLRDLLSDEDDLSVDW